jgi:hypothetical protein
MSDNNEYPKKEADGTLGPMESNAPMDQDPKPNTSETAKRSPTSSPGVFLMRAPGMPFDQFKRVCIQRLIEAGLIKTEKKDEKS